MTKKFKVSTYEREMRKPEFKAAFEKSYAELCYEEKELIMLSELDRLAIVRTKCALISAGMGTISAIGVITMLLHVFQVI